MKKICVLTGAGISAESGLKTFRDAGGLWEGMDVMSVASLEGWHRNPALVLDFYNQRRQQLNQVEPNEAHYAIAQLDKNHSVTVITQNVDDLHERAGSSQVLHLHGELRKVRSIKKGSLSVHCETDISLGDKDEEGFQLRPDIVWFGEEVPLLGQAAKLVHEADVIIVIGSSMQVYPAASLVAYCQALATVVYVDLNPSLNYELAQLKNLTIFEGKASIKTKEALEHLRKASLI